MSTTDNQQAELERPVAREVYFVEFQFASGTQRACTAMQTINWGGYDWLGLGSVAGIGDIEETGGTAARQLRFTLNVANPSWLALAGGDVEEYRGRPAKLYMCPLDEQFRLVDTPMRCWSGKMQTVSIAADGDNSQIQLNCETSAYDLKRAASMRLNAAQHKQKYPNDQGFDYLEDLIANPQVWLSKRFQRI